MKNSITSLKDWKPARQFPETYPGDCPPHSYFILDDLVFPLQFEDPHDFSSGYLVQADGRRKGVDSLLASLGLPALANRYASLAFGANRNPATLHIKFLNYAESIAKFTLDSLWDDLGGFYDRPKRTEDLGALATLNSPLDENRVATDAFLRLHCLTYKKEYLETAKRTLEHFGSTYKR